MTVCYNTKTAIQTVWSSGGTSDSVVIEWWTSLCDAKTGACIRWLVALTKIPDFPDCAGVPGQRRTKNPRWELIKWPLAGKTQEESSTGLEAGARENLRSTHPPTQMQPQAQTARTQRGPQRRKS